MGGQFYTKARDVGKGVLKQVPPLLELAKRLEQQAKGMVVPATMFEQFGFSYIGPIDGRDLDSLIPRWRTSKGLRGLSSLHVVTRRPGPQAGRGRPVAYHGGNSDQQSVWSSQPRLPSRLSPRCLVTGSAIWLPGPTSGRYHTAMHVRARAWWSSTSAFQPLLRRGHRRAAYQSRSPAV